MYNKFDLLIILTFILCFISKERNFAQWQEIERPEIKIPISTYSVAAKGDTLFVGTYRSTIYRSTDNGVTWTKCDFGSTIIHWIYDFLIDVNMIYAMGEEGIFRSSNMGETWELKNNGLHASFLMNVYSMVKSDSLLFAATDFGVYKSSNNGDNWYPVNCDSSYWPIYSLAVLNGSVFAGSAKEGIFRSTNNGISWKAINNGMPYYYSNTKRINTLFVDGENIYAGTNQWGIYYSSDNGNMWLPDTQGLNLQNYGLHYPVYDIAKIDNYIYIGTQNDGIYRHYGTTGIWTKVNTNLPDNSYVQSLIGVKNKIFAATHEGLFYSSRDTIAWIPAFTEYPMKVNINHISSSGNNLFISTSNDFYLGSISASFYTPNTGNIWIKDSVLSKYYIRDFSAYGDSLYAFGSGLFFSPNNGVNWIKINSNNINTFIKNNDTLFIGSGFEMHMLEHGEIFLSEDNGNSWNEIWNKDTAVYSIEKIGNNLFAASFNQIFRSTNTGLNWTAINYGLPLSSQYIMSLHTIGKNLILCTQNGIYLSTKYGNYWSPRNNGLPVDTYGFSLIHLLTHNNHLYASTNYGIYFSNNLGESWTLISNVFFGDDISIMESTVLGNDLVVATSDGLWKFPLSEIKSDKQVYYLSQNYPNPFNSSTTINYIIPKTSFVVIEVYDILGKRVTTLVNEEKPAGEYTVEFESSNLSSGIYFYQLQAGDFIEAKKMISMR